MKEFVFLFVLAIYLAMAAGDIINFMHKVYG